MKYESLLLITVLLVILFIISVVISFKLKNKNNDLEIKVHFLNNDIKTLECLAQVLKNKLNNEI